MIALALWLELVNKVREEHALPKSAGTPSLKKQVLRRITYPKVIKFMKMQAPIVLRLYRRSNKSCHDTKAMERAIKVPKNEMYSNDLSVLT